MFQRLKGAIDSRIAEEQARQRASQGTPSLTNPTNKAGTSRSKSPAIRPGRNRTPDTRRREPAPKGPDPSEFEPDFVLDDDDALSRSGTSVDAGNMTGDTAMPGRLQAVGNPEPRQDTSLEKELVVGTVQSVEKSAEGQSSAPGSDLPTDVRVKLRKLDRLESRYQDLLRSYRIAHARVSAIEQFESALRENTPLTSISDPGALVEYLNQVNLKGDMVLDELKRVTNEKTSVKQKLDEAEKSTKEAWDEVARLKEAGKTVNDLEAEHASDRKATNVLTETFQLRSTDEASDAEESQKSPPLSGMLKSSGITGFFSPKLKQSEEQETNEEPEEFFSYDSEIPRLEKELKNKQNEVTGLQKEVKSLKKDLSVARESTQSMVQTLEEATREANMLRDKVEEQRVKAEEQRVSAEEEMVSLRTELEAADGKFRKLEILRTTTDTVPVAVHEKLISQANAEIAKLRDLENVGSRTANENAQLHAQVETLEAKIKVLEESKGQDAKRVETLKKLLVDLREQLKKAEISNQQLKSELESSIDAVNTLRVSIVKKEPSSPDVVGTTDQTENVDTTASTENKASSESLKRKKKKKTKAGKPSNELSVIDPNIASAGIGDGQEHEQLKLQQELISLKQLVAEKDTAIERLDGKLKGEDDMKDEIEGLRDDLVNLGQEHVQAKESLKSLEAEKAALKTTIAQLEKEVVDLRRSQVASTKDSSQTHEALSHQFEELRVKSIDLQTDLSVAQQLASSRFKDLTDLRAIISKVQPEISTLRKENAQFKSNKDELIARLMELEKIEARHNAIRSELQVLKKNLSERDAEISALKQALTQETNGRRREEEARAKVSRDLDKAEADRKQLGQSLERASSDLARNRDDLAASRSKINELEIAASRLEQNMQSLKEEVELKSAQYASAESLMTSMRDQTAEMVTQSKEARERCESLEEEVADAHRLLGERSREAETMRRLLGEVEGRAESRVREMKDRMDTAIEERDRAEDEASTAGRRRARELEEIRGKLRDAERNLKRAENDKEELETVSREWKKRREELEARADSSGKESEEVRRAMGALRDALDESERQARELERQKADLRRSLEDSQQRLERLQKTNKVMSDELRVMQAKAKASTSQAQSPRSSFESMPSRSKAPSIDTNSNGQGAPATDYLKNVILQFLETREQKHKLQLIPVFRMLLHFDGKDEQKWIAAITAK